MDDSTARIKRAIDLVALVGEYLPLTRAGAKFKGLCPFHEDHTPSLTVDPNYQSFKCWACGAGGDVFNFLQRIERIDFVEAKRRLADRAGVPLERNPAGSSDSRQTIFRALAWAANWFQDCLFKTDGGAAARAYLGDRGFDLDVARRHGLGYSPASFDALLKAARQAGFKPDVLFAAGLVRRRERDGGYYDAFRGRLMFAIRDERKRVVGFGARVLPGADAQDGAKYLNSVASSAYQKSEVLYGLDVALEGLRQQKDGPRRLVLMEGYTDCLQAYQAGFPFAVATCGTALTPMQLRKLRQHAETIVLMFDGDKAGERAAQRALDLFLSSDLLVRIALLPGGEDPADFIRRRGLEALTELVDRAPDALEFALQFVKARHDLETVEGRLEAMEDILTMFAALPVGTSGDQKIRFDAAIMEAAVNFGADQRSVLARLDELRRQRRRPGAPVAAAPEHPDPFAGKMDRRERQIVSWLVTQPGRAAQRLQDLFPAAGVRHPTLRRLVEEAYRLYQQQGELASCDELREALNDPALDAWIMQAQAEVPEGEAYEQGLADIAAALIVDRRREEIAAQKRRSAD